MNHLAVRINLYCPQKLTFSSLPFSPNFYPSLFRSRRFLNLSPPGVVPPSFRLIALICRASIINGDSSMSSAPNNCHFRNQFARFCCVVQLKIHVSLGISYALAIQHYLFVALRPHLWSLNCAGAIWCFFFL